MTISGSRPVDLSGLEAEHATIIADIAALAAEHVALAIEHATLAAEHASLAAEHVTILADIATVDTVVDGIVVDVAAVQTVVDANAVALAAIKAVTDALAVLTEAGATVTTDGTEQDVYINNAPSGIFLPIMVKIDFTNHTATETIILRTYYRIKTGGNYIQQDAITYVGVVSPELINIRLEPNRFGIKTTIEKTAGTNRDYDWEAAYEI